MTNPATNAKMDDAVWRQPRWSLFFRMREFTDMPWGARVRVHWRAHLRMLRSPRIALASSLISLIPAFGFALLVWWTDPLGPRYIRAGDLTPTELLILAGAVVVVWLVTQHLVFIYVLNRFYAPIVRRELTAMGMPMCPACGQRLADTAVARCSECGTRLRPGHTDIRQDPEAASD